MVDSPAVTAPKSIDDLKPSSYNPRRISKRAAAALARSLGDFGDVGGIVWNARTGHLVAGHQRVDQLRQLGAQLIDGDIVTAAGDRFPVRVVDWDEAKEKAANVVANNPHIAGEFTDDLGPLLEEIQGSIGLTAFADLALDDLLEDVKLEPEEEKSSPPMCRCPKCGAEHAEKAGAE